MKATGAEVRGEVNQGVGRAQGVWAASSGRSGVGRTNLRKETPSQTGEEEKGDGHTRVELKILTQSHGTFSSYEQTSQPKPQSLR